MEHSDEFLRFAKSVHGGITSRSDLEDYDLAALAKLEGSEREAAKLMCLEKLEERAEDPRAPRALVRLGDPSAVPAMRDALAAYRPNNTKVALAEALWELEQSEEAIEALQEILGGAARNERVRNRAAYALAKINDPRADDALAVAMQNDSSSSVRISAETALYQKHRIDDLMYRKPEGLADIDARLRSGDAEVRRAAIDDFGAEARRLKSKS